MFTAIWQLISPILLAKEFILVMEQLIKGSKD